jgi:hypothetical protein
MDDPIWSPTTFSKNRDRLLDDTHCACCRSTSSGAPPRLSAPWNSNSSAIRSSERGPARSVSGLGDIDDMKTLRDYVKMMPVGSTDF